MPKIAKPEVKQLAFEDLKVRNVYRAKRPKEIGLFTRYLDDRDIRYISQHRSIVDRIDHGYHQEFIDWCNAKSFPSRFAHSEVDQIEYEQKTGKEARNIEPVWDYTVQYDSPSVKNGKNYPTISASKFLKWAAEDVTTQMPDNGDWATKP